MEYLSTSMENSFQQLQNLINNTNIPKTSGLSAQKILIKILNQKSSCYLKHSKRVSVLAGKLAKHCDLEKTLIKKIKLAALFHDIGKLAISDEILNSPNRLTEEEFNIVKQHSKMGSQLLCAIEDFQEISKYVLEHHERYDGLGYPNKINGEVISLPARIISIADSYDAMITDRPYKKAYSKEKAIDELLKNSGTQFDPELVQIFIKKVLKTHLT